MPFWFSIIHCDALLNRLYKTGFSASQAIFVLRLYGDQPYMDFFNKPFKMFQASGIGCCYLAVESHPPSSICLRSSPCMVRRTNQVAVYFRVRRAAISDGTSIREAARTFGLHLDAVRMMPAFLRRRGTGVTSRPTPRGSRFLRAK